MSKVTLLPMHTISHYNYEYLIIATNSYLNQTFAGFSFEVSKVTMFYFLRINTNFLKANILFGMKTVLCEGMI